MPSIPIEHITDSQQLSADAELDFYELTPAGQSGVIYFKNDNTMTWKGNEYAGIPLTFSGEVHTADGNAVQPQLVLGQTNIDLSVFKGLIYDGSLDGAKIVRHRVLLTHALANQDIKVSRTYRVKRVDTYSAIQIVLALATFTVTGPSTMPFRQFLPPDFPFVRI